MEKKTLNSMEQFTETVSEDVVIDFTKNTNTMNVSVYGRILKQGAEVGSITYDKGGNNMTLSYKPFDALTFEEKNIICQKAMPCISELIG